MKRSRKQQLKEELKQICEVPKPVGKEAFLTQYRRLQEQALTGMTRSRKQEHEKPRQRQTQPFQEQYRRPMSLMRLVAVQLTYFSKWMWLLSGIIFAAAVWFQQVGELQWAVCACIPFLGMVTVEQSFCSPVFQMAELEQASRWSLKSVAAVRMGLLGAGNLVFLLALTLGTQDARGMQGLLFLVPYLMTSFGCLQVTRRLRGKEAVYAGAGVAAAVSCLQMVLYSKFVWLTHVSYSGLWLAVAAVLLGVTGKELGRILGKTEELVWN